MPESMSLHREKRKHSRVPSKLPLRYILLQETPQKPKHAQSYDLSVGGMSFHNFEFIPHSTQALIELVPPDQLDPVRVLSEVVHTRKHSSGDHFTIGIRFKHILK